MASVNKNLSALEDTGLIRVAQLEPDIEYIFRHELIRDAIYTTMVRTSRRDLHKAAAEAIETLYPNRKDTDLAAQLAQHFSEAQEAERALHYAALAGDNAYSRYANMEAGMFFQMALDHAKKLNDFDRQFELFEKLGHAYEHTGRQADAVELYGEWRRMAQEATNQPAELEAVKTLLSLRAVPTLVYDEAIARQLGDEGIALARNLGDRKSEASVLWSLSTLSAHTGDYMEAVRFGEESLAIARELNAREQIAYSLNDLASFAYIDAGNLERGKEALQEARQLWIELDNQPMLGDCLATTTRYDAILGNYDDVIARSKEAADLAEATNNPWGQSYSRFIAWNIYVQRGDISKGMEEGNLSIDWARKAGFAGALVGIQAEIGVLLAELGRPDEGLARAKESLDVSESVLTGWHSWPLGAITKIHILRDDLKSAQATFKQLDQALDTQFLEAGQSHYYAKVQMQLSKRRFDEARQDAQRWLDRVLSIGANGLAPGSFYQLGKVLAAMGKRDEAREAFIKAREFAERLEGRWLLWQILAAHADLDSDDVLRQEATKHVLYVADHITDKSLRMSFLDQPRIKTLTGH